MLWRESYTHIYVQSLPHVFYAALCASSSNIAGCIVGTCPPSMSFPHQVNYSNMQAWNYPFRERLHVLNQPCKDSREAVWPCACVYVRASLRFSVFASASIHTEDQTKYTSSWDASLFQEGVLVWKAFAFFWIAFIVEVPSHDLAFCFPKVVTITWN